MIAIDPGANGAIVYSLSDGGIAVKELPTGIDEIMEAIRDARFGDGDTTRSLYCFIEQVGSYMPGNSATAAVKFARHCGHVEMAVHAAGLAMVQVSPQKWMKHLGSLPKEKADRKRAIKSMMALRFPDEKVTLKNADALGIYCYALDWMAARKEARNATL